jgi:hypothetical protein
MGKNRALAHREPVGRMPVDNLFVNINTFADETQKIEALSKNKLCVFQVQNQHYIY